MEMHTEILTFIIALIASLGLTVPVRSLALHYGFVDHPGPRKVHAKPIPLLGGAAIYLGFVLATLLTLHGQPRWQVAGIIAGGTLVVIVGFLDDRGLLHHQIKLFVGMPVAALLLVASGIRAQLFRSSFPARSALPSTSASPFSGSWASPPLSASSTTWMVSVRASLLWPRRFSPCRPSPMAKPWCAL